MSLLLKEFGVLQRERGGSYPSIEIHTESQEQSAQQHTKMLGRLNRIEGNTERIANALERIANVLENSLPNIPLLE